MPDRKRAAGRKGDHMAKSVKCPICGTEFETERPNKKYCSFVCKEAGRRLQRMKWEKNNAGYNAVYMRKYRAEHKERSEDTP